MHNGLQSRAHNTFSVMQPLAVKGFACTASIIGPLALVLVRQKWQGVMTLWIDVRSTTLQNAFGLKNRS